MARTKYWDFRAEDSTSLFNDRLRAILHAGVYAGFNVGLGSGGGFKLKFTHDPDPDNTGEVLGKLVTHDGVIIEENEDQDDIVTGFAPGAADEIHYVVASYVYNEALPNNDVAYFVKTAVAPSVPTLTDDEVLLAEIDVPASAGDYSTSDIKTVQKLTLYENLNVIKKFTDILDPGIYEGIEIEKGSGDLDVTLTAGTWITQETRNIVEASDQTDLFTLTNPGAGLYRYAWVIGMHKDENTDPIPEPDYLLVEGTAVVIGSATTLPNNSAILAAAAAVNSKYDDESYINKLGYIRVENRAGTYYIEYIRGTTVLDDNTIVVYGAEASSLNRSGKYYGHQGLIEAISDIYAITEESSDSLNLKTPYTLLLDGRFKLGDTPLRIPSHVKLRGLGAPAIIESDLVGDVIRLQGFEAYYNGSNDTVTQVTGPSTPPSGYVSRTFEIQATYRSGDDLVARLLTYGDTVRAQSYGGGDSYTGYVVQTITTSNNWTVEVFIEDSYNTDGNPTDLHIAILKRNSHLENVLVRPINSGSGQLTAQLLENCSFDMIEVSDLVFDRVTECRIGKLVASGSSVSWNSTTSTIISPLRNVYHYIKLTGGLSSLTVNESVGTYIGLLEYSGETESFAFNLNIDNARVDAVTTIGSSSAIDIKGDQSSYGHLSGNGVYFEGDYNTVLDVRSAELEFYAGSANNVVLFGDYTTFTDTAADPTNRVMFSTSATHFDEVAEIPHSDRNLKLVSIANIDWDLATDTLTWDAPLKFDNPWTSGYSQIAIGSAVLDTDGDRLYADLARDATGTTVVSESVRAKASASTDRYTKNRVFVALRDQDVIYLWDGTRIEDGQSVKIGSTPPPDGSVTYSKLAADALAYHHAFFRDYVSPTESGFTNDIIVRNTDLRTFAYTAATGVVLYSGSIDLSNVVPGDVIILRDDSWPGAHTREEILAVDDVGNNITIAKGLSVTSGASANIWNGAIARGNKVLTNNNLNQWEYDPDGSGTEGRITGPGGTGLGWGFSAQQVKVGYVFLDNSGNKYRILDRDATGNGDWIEIGAHLRGVDDGVPSDRHGGSIETNNNPLSLPIADLRSQVGMEFIPIDSMGSDDEIVDDTLYRLGNTSFSTIDGLIQRRLSEPYDPRIRVWGGTSTRSEGPYQAQHGTNLGANNILGPGPQGIQIVEFTGMCTGIALVTAWKGTVAGGAIAGIVDGYEDGTVSLALWDTNDMDNTYVMEQNTYHIMTSPKLMRMPSGVHDISFVIGSDHFDDCVIRGVIVVNSPADTPVLTESPGSLVQLGQVRSMTHSQHVAMPANPATYDKGGRIVRYVDENGSRQWSYNWVRSFTDTGDLASGSGAVQNVGNLSQWRVGDLILVVDTANNLKYIHVVTGKTGTAQLDVSPTAKYTQSGETLRYYGRMYNPDTIDFASRDDEEIAQTFPISEFAAAGPLDNSRGVAGRGTAVTRTVRMGVSLSDLVTKLAADQGIRNDDSIGTGSAKLKIQTVSDQLIIWFVGTGLSMMIDTVTAVDVTIDGVAWDGGADNNNATVNIDSRTYIRHTDAKGFFICGDLPYGEHLVILTAGVAPDIQIAGVTVWQPKKPTFTGFELSDMNVLAETDADLGVDEHANGVAMYKMQHGNIPIEGSIIQGDDRGVKDVSSVANTILNRAFESYVVATAASQGYEIPFYGDELSIMVTSVTLGGGSNVTFEVLGNDGNWRAPSACSASAGGFTVTGGPDSISGVNGVVGGRYRYIFSRLGFHVMRYQSAQSGDQLQIDHLEVATPYHVHKTKEPAAIDHWMPFQLCGNDKRNLSPFRTDLFPTAQKTHHQGAVFHAWSNTDIQNQMPFWFYSRGGWMEISVQSAVTEATSIVSKLWYVGIDGNFFDNGVCRFDTQAGSTGSTLYYLSLSLVVWLEPGFHWAYLQHSDLSDEVVYTSWSAKYVASVPNQLPSRGLGPGLIGPSSEPNF